MTQPRYHVHGEIHADGERLILFGTGNIAEAVGRLHLLTPHFRATDVPGGLQVPLRWPVVCQIAGEMGPSWLPGPRLQAWIAEQVAARTSLEPLRADWFQPGAPPPRSYQTAGAQLIASTGSGLICDDPGTGKTLTALMALAELQARGALPMAGPLLVICPSSVVDSWCEIAQEWMRWRVIPWRGTPLRRSRLHEWGGAGLYVVGYGLVSKDIELLTALRPSAVVIDECHQIKNPTSDRSKAVVKLASRARSVIAMSGTPITHHAGDLHQTLKALDAVSWPSAERFSHRYLATVPGDYSDEVLGLNRYLEPEFRMCLAGQYRRLAKEDVLPELPPKVYTERHVELPAAARKAYREMEARMLAELDDGTELPAFEVLTQLQRLIQLANASCDVDISHGPDVDETTGLPKMHVHVAPREPSWKIDELIAVLDERPGKQVLVFAPSAALVKLAGERAAKAGYRVGYVIGERSQAQRTADVAAFQAGQLDVICATTGAGGVGITLTAASTEVFLQRPWSFVEASQAEDRAHRIGSEIHDSIEIIDIVATDTVDARVREVLKGKAAALGELLGDARIAARCLGG